MLDPPPMIEFLKLRACLVRMNGARAPIATQNNSTVYSGKTENKGWFQAAVRNDTVVPCR